MSGRWDQGSFSVAWKSTNLLPLPQTPTPRPSVQLLPMTIEYPIHYPLKLMFTSYYPRLPYPPPLGLLQNALLCQSCEIPLLRDDCGSNECKPPSLRYPTGTLKSPPNLPRSWLCALVSLSKRLLRCWSDIWQMSKSSNAVS